MRQRIGTSRASQSRLHRAFTLVELLVVIAIMGIFIAMIIPAVQAAREAARRMQCSSNLGQLAMAVSNYEMAFGHLPAGTQAASGPIINRPQGYHHGWIGQLLPYLDRQNAFNQTDFSVSVYHANNEPVRQLTIGTLVCPSSAAPRQRNSHYAGVHHPVEAPIDVDNRGVFFLNSAVRYDDISDGLSHTLFIGEKIPEPADLGWMSGTRSILRNLGPRLNVTGMPPPPKRVLPSEDEYPPYDDFFDEPADDPPAIEPASDPPAIEPASDPVDQPDAADSSEPATAEPPAEPVAADPSDPVAVGLRAKDIAAIANAPEGALPVGGFSSYHSGGAMFSFGDGNVRFMSDQTNKQVLEQLGDRSDGLLIEVEEYR